MEQGQVLEDTVLGMHDLAWILRCLLAWAALRHDLPVQLLLPVHTVVACIVCSGYCGCRAASIRGSGCEHRFAALLERAEVARFDSDVAAATIVQLSGRCLRFAFLHVQRSVRGIGRRLGLVCNRRSRHENDWLGEQADAFSLMHLLLRVLREVHALDGVRGVKQLARRRCS